MLKTFCLPALLLSMLLFLSNCKKENGSAGMLVPVTIIKHCTGPYLRYEGKDYFICNGNIAESFEDGAAGMALFTKIPNCKNPEVAGTCQAVHPSEGYVEVAELK